MIHHVFACKSNIGDWLSARGVQSLLAPQPITEHLCDEPFVPDTLARLERADAHDVIVIGGGGLFMDYFAPFWEGMAAIAARVPTCLWGVGYCDLKQALSTPSQAVLDRVVARSRLVVVRDQLTRDRFANQITAEPVACPAVVTLGASHGTAKGLLHAVHYDVVGSAAYGVMDRVGRAFAARTGRAYLQTDNQIMDGSEQELAERLRRYAAADLVLSSRLHGCIIGLAMGLKVLAVSGDWKLEAFMQSMGLEGWVLSPHRLDRLEDRLEALPSQPSVQAQLDRMRRSNRAVGASICRLAAELREMCRCDETRAVCGVAV